MPTLREEIYLIGFPNLQITGSKLPSKGDCLKVLFFNIRFTKLNVQESARLVVKECSIFWEKANIPVRQFHRAVKKLLDLYDEWKYFVKTKNRDGETYKIKRVEWEDGLDDLFDIAHNDALNIIKIEEDKQFLLNQRLKGRPGSMLGVDVKLLKKNERIQKRTEAEEMRKIRNMEAPSTSKGKVLYF